MELVFKYLIIVMVGCSVVACTSKSRNHSDDQKPQTGANVLQKPEEIIVGKFANEYGDQFEVMPNMAFNLSRSLSNEDDVRVCTIKLEGKISKIKPHDEGTGFTISYRYFNATYEKHKNKGSKKNSDSNINQEFCLRLFKQYKRDINKEMQLEVSSATHEVIELKNHLLTQIDNESSRFFTKVPGTF